MTVDGGRESSRRYAFALLAGLALHGAAFAQAGADDGPNAVSAPHWTLKFGARLQVNHDSFSGLYSQSGRRAGETYPRRATIEFSGRVFEHWKYGLDVKPLENGSAVLDSLTLAYSGFGATVLSAGRFKPDFSLEEATSSNWVTGIERSAIWDLAPDAADRDGSWGLEVRNHGRRHHASLGLFDKPEQRALALRVVVAPLLQRERALHLGLSYARAAIDASNGRIRTRLGVRGVSEGEHGNRPTLARSSGGEAFSGDHAAVLEFAYVQGPFSVQSEVLRRELSGAGDQPRRVARGQYVQLAYTLTGQTRPYKIDGGKFGEIDPAHARLGAWELFYRHDRLAVDGEPGLLDGGRSQARARVHALGLNWYVNRSIKVSVNHLWSAAHSIANQAGDRHGRALSLRLQLLI